MGQTYDVKREKRFHSTARAVVVGKSSRTAMETTHTDNISSHGARVITSKEWQRGETVLIALPDFQFTAAARVAYCEALGDGSYRTGLQFTGATEDLDRTLLAASLKGFSS